MRINAAVTLVLLLLVVVAGWIVGRSASPKTVTLFIGIAIGLIAGAPIYLLLAIAIWYILPQLERVGPGNTNAGVASPVASIPTPTVIVVSPAGVRSRRQWQVAQEIESPPPHMLGGY